MIARGGWAIRKILELLERWLGRAHLANWLLDSLFSTASAAVSGWWVHANGGTIIGVALSTVGALVIAFGVGAFLISVMRTLAGWALVPVWGTYIPLHQAAAHLYGETRGPEIAEFAEGLNNSPNEILDWYAYWLTLKGVRIFGRVPPSPKIEQIPEDEVQKLHFSEGARQLIENYKNTPRYVDLAVRRADLRKHYRELVRSERECD